MTASESTAEALLAEADAAARADDHTTALRLLKAAAEAHPAHAGVATRLGAEYAHLELFEAAEAQLDRALALAPETPLARCHLGLLQATRGRFEEALASWQPLEALPDAHPLRHYKRAFDALAADALDAAREQIDAGLAADCGDALLDGQMRRLRDSLPG
jgi:Flp pilus assembly protein TadD